jgi:glycosyltransferase involved in cell wall biosynthesis
LYYAPYSCAEDTFQTAHSLLAGAQEELRAEFGIGRDDGPIILSVSRLIEKKQPFMLLEAFRQIRARVQCTLLVVGDGHLERAMRHRVLAEHIPNVVFASFLNQSRIGRAYAASDIFALASSGHETWGVVVNEAMTVELPLVLSNRVGSTPDLVSVGVNGYIVSFDSVDAWVSRLTELVCDPAERAAFGRASAERVLAYNYEAAAAGVLRATCDAVGRARWERATPRDGSGR